MPRTRTPTKKAKKKSPMKCVRPDCRNSCVQPNLICAKHLRAFKRTALYRGIQRIREQHPAPTPSPDRRVEEVRKIAERVYAAGHCMMGPAYAMAIDILRILNSKGPR